MRQQLLLVHPITIHAITAAVEETAAALARDTRSVLHLDPKKVQTSFLAIEPYLNDALEITGAISEAIGNRTLAEVSAYAEKKGIPMLEAWLHTTPENMGSVLLQVGVAQLQRQHAKVSKDDAVTAIQLAQRFGRLK